MALVVGGRSLLLHGDDELRGGDGGEVSLTDVVQVVKGGGGGAQVDQMAVEHPASSDPARDDDDDGQDAQKEHAHHRVDERVEVLVIGLGSCHGNSVQKRTTKVHVYRVSHNQCFKIQVAK